jgi:hypothetical protein
MYGVMLVVRDQKGWEATGAKVPTDPITGKPFDSQRNGGK